VHNKFLIVILFSFFTLSACEVNTNTAHRSGTIDDDFIEDPLSGNSIKYAQILETSNQLIELIKSKEYEEIHNSFVADSVKKSITKEAIKQAYSGAVTGMGEFIEYKEMQWGFRPTRDSNAEYIVSYKIVLHQAGRLDYYFSFIKDGDHTKVLGFAIKPRKKARMPNEA